MLQISLLPLIFFEVEAIRLRHIFFLGALTPVEQMGGTS